MKKIIATALCILLATGINTAGAAETQNVTSKKPSVKAGKASTSAKNQRDTPFKDQSKAIAETIAKKYPGTKITSVQESPIAGLYEVLMGKNVAYVDTKADLFLFGHIFNMSTQEDLTQTRLEDINRVDFKKLPLDKAIKIVKGNGARVFAVFTDPDCPYCKVLEQNMTASDNYTMYVMLYPINELHPEATDRANKIWCANDKAAAWHTFMVEGTLPTEAIKNCSSPVADLALLAKSLDINGTPTLVRADGKRIAGAPHGPMLESFLSGDKLAPQMPPPQR